MNVELRKKINAKFVIRVTDSFGKVKLIGGGQLHKYIGMYGLVVAETLAHEALRGNDKTYTTGIRGIKIVFHKK